MPEVNATANPKLANFRWKNKAMVARSELQERPTGIERWNMAPTDLKRLKFTEAYKTATRLSEFVGINGTTKSSDDAELLAIYETAHALYQERERDGRTWHTMHSVVYSEKGMECLYVQEDFTTNYCAMVRTNRTTDRKTYSYNPTQVGARGKDRMRFELGDTEVEGEGQTAALSDEEYEAVLAANPKSWRKAKLALVESIMRRFSYEVDEKVGPLSLSLRQRHDSWKAMYDQLKAEIIGMSVPSVNPTAISGDHYFYEGMHENPNAGGTEGGGRLV